MPGSPRHFPITNRCPVNDRLAKQAVTSVVPHEHARTRVRRYRQARPERSFSHSFSTTVQLPHLTRLIDEGQATMVLNGLIRFQRRVAVKVIEVSAANANAADENTESSLILDLALALSKDCRNDIARRTKNGLEAARRCGYLGGRRPVLDDEKRAAILARRERGQSIPAIAAGVNVSIEAVQKTLTDTKTF